MFEITSTPEYKSFHIGSVKIANPLVLAPMAGITDTVFRKIIKSMGAGLLYSDMISCQALHYANKKTFRMLDFLSEELPLSVQIFGSDPSMMAEAAKIVEDSGASIVDINLGCSVPKVAQPGSGAALCRNLPLLAKILEKTVKAVAIPVTIKIRIGWSLKEVSAFEVCKIAEECGISAIALHGRTSAQKYSGNADWDFISRFALQTKLPVIGNGDITKASQGAAILENTACSGVMIGREAYNNPWIFKSILALLQGEKQEQKTSYIEIKQLILHQLEGMTERYGEESGVRKMRKFGSCYTRGLPKSAKFRDDFFRLEKKESMISLVEDYFSYICS